jgi:armadillo repeat-containing protein 8
MARVETSAILNELQTPSSISNQVQALRSLKNEIVGHNQRKEKWISQGVVLHLKRILETHKLSSKRRQRDVGIIDSSREQPRSDEEEARLQAIAIVGSLAHGLYPKKSSKLMKLTF